MTLSTPSNDNLVNIHSRVLQSLPFFESKRAKVVGEFNKDKDASSSFSPGSCTSRSKPSYNKETSTKSVLQCSSHLITESERLRKHLKKLKRRKVFLISEIEREKCLNNIEYTSVGLKIANISSLAHIKSNMRPYLHPFDIKESNFSSLDLTSRINAPVCGVLNATAFTSKTQYNFNDLSNENYRIHLKKSLSSFRTDNSKKGSIISSPINLASKFSLLRKRRKLIAAHSLSGISCMYLKKENSIGAKIEICIDGGIFISTHCAIFEMIKYKSNAYIDHNDYPHDHESEFDNDDDNEDKGKKKTVYNKNMYYIRLIQHTLPYSIKVNEILEKHVCKEAINFDDASYKPDLIHSLKNCLGDMYDAAYSYAQRVSACRRLENLVIDDINDNIVNESKMMIKNVSHSESYDFITFTLFTFPQSKSKVRRKSNYEKKLKIELKYSNQIISIPTHVEVELNVGLNKILSSGNDNVKGIKRNDYKIDAYKTFAPLFRVMNIIDATNRSWTILKKTD